MQALTVCVIAQRQSDLLLSQDRGREVKGSTPHTQSQSFDDGAFHGASGSHEERRVVRASHCYYFVFIRLP